MTSITLELKVEDVPMHGDSHSTIFIAKNPMYYERTKHIDVKLHYIQDSIANGQVI